MRKSISIYILLSSVSNCEALSSTSNCQARFEETHPVKMNTFTVETDLECCIVSCACMGNYQPTEWKHSWFQKFFDLMVVKNYYISWSLSLSKKPTFSIWSPIPPYDDYKNPKLSISSHIYAWYFVVQFKERFNEANLGLYIWFYNIYPDQSVGWDQKQKHTLDNYKDKLY